MERGSLVSYALAVLLGMYTGTSTTALCMYANSQRAEIDAYFAAVCRG